MVPGRVKLQLFAFLLLSGGVVANILILQPLSRARQVAEASLEPQARYEGFGDTGSIGADARKKTLPRYADGVRSDPARGRTSAKSTEVTKAVQRELQLRGYETGGTDGVETLITRAAIMAFEFDHGLRLTGRSSQGLLKGILLGGGSARSRSAGSGGESAAAKEVIGTVQEALAGLGYRPGRVSGILSRDTKRAIRAFERDQALPVTGRVSGPLVARLTRLSGEGRIAAVP